MCKKIFKPIILISLLFFIIINFSACSQVKVMTVTNEDGTIDELVSITLDVEAVVNAGYNVADLKIEIESISKNKANEIAQNLNTKINRDLFLVQDKESIDTLNGFKDGITAVASQWKENTYVVGIRFENVDVYKYYYNIKEETKTKTYIEEHFFYDKVYYYASNMYVKHNALYSSMNNYFSAHYNGLIDSETNQLTYTYISDLRRQHSDADFVTKQNGKYYHTWVVDKDNLEDPIMLYYNVANPEASIIVSVAITFGVTLGLFVVGFVINKNKKNDTD